MKDGHHSTEMGCAVTNPPKQKKIAMRWIVLSRQKFNHISRYFFVIITFKVANLGRSFFLPPQQQTCTMYEKA